MFLFPWPVFLSRQSIIILSLIISLLLLGACAQATPNAAVTPSASAILSTATPTPPATATPTPLPSVTPLPTATPSPTVSPSPTPTASPTEGPLGLSQARLQDDESLHLTMTNGDTQSLPTALSEEHPDFWGRFPQEVLVQDLDADGLDDVTLILMMPGASCCTTLSIAYFNPATQSYTLTESLYRKFTLGFDMQDLDDDGLPEFRTLNEDFNYALGGATVVSFFSPLQIWRYDSGQLQDVTPEFPDLVAEHAQHWAEDEELFCTIFGAGAYLAEMHLLNQGQAAWDTLDATCLIPDEERTLIQQALTRFGYDSGEP